MIVAVFYVEALCDAVFDFIGVGERGVGIEADEAFEIVDAGDIAIGHFRLDGVFVLALGVRAVKKFFQAGRAVKKKGG